MQNRRESGSFSSSDTPNPRLYMGLREIFLKLTHYPGIPEGTNLRG